MSSVYHLYELSGTHWNVLQGTVAHGSIRKIMKIKPVIFLPAFFVPLMMALPLSCDKLETDAMKLTNDTSQITYYQAMTVEVSNAIDPNPIISVESTHRRNRIIPSGETVTLYEEDIWGYSPGDDVAFHFYEVIGDTAYMSGVLKMTHNQLYKLRFHVVIDDEELTTRYE